MALFQRSLPKFNRYSFDVIQNSQDKLLPPQHEALQELQKHFTQNLGGIGLVSMPTGSGKTGVISCLPYFLGQLGMNQPQPGAPPYGEALHKFDKPVLVIAPDLSIANQLEETLTVCAHAPGENFLLKRNIIPPDAVGYVLPVGKKIEETKHICNPEFLQSKEVIIANAQKFLKDEWEKVLPDDIFKLVIVDEAHHHPSMTWRRIVEKFRNHAMVVFLTATPFRGDGQRVLPREEGKIVYRLSLQDARQQRVIRGTSWHDPLVAGGTNVDEIFCLILERVKDIQEDKDARNPLPDGIPHMAIAITKNIAYAEQVALLWNTVSGNAGSAIAYHSDLRPTIRNEMMEVIKTNMVKLVVVVESLLEGFDHPPISIAAIMTKIVSPVKFAQFIGRAQRIVRGRDGPEGDEILADIVTHAFFEQEENKRAFEEERLIPVD